MEDELCVWKSSFNTTVTLQPCPTTSDWKPQAIMPKCVNVEGSNGEEAIMNTEDANLQKFDTRAVSLAESTSKLKTAEPTTETALRMSEWAEKRSSADTHLLERMREVSPFAIDKGSYQLAVQLEELEELKMRNLELTESVNNLTREKEVLAEVFRIGQVCPLYLLYQYKSTILTLRLGVGRNTCTMPIRPLLRRQQQRMP